MKMIQKAFSYRLRPIKQQEVLFSKSAGSARFIYNWGLAQIKHSLEKEKKILSYVKIANQLPLLKKAEETVWLSEIHSQILQQTLKDLEASVKHFFKQRGKRKHVGFPKFKKKGVKDSFRYPQGVKCLDGKVFLPKVGWVRYYDSRLLEGTIQQATVKRVGEHWYISIVCEIPHAIEQVVINEKKAIGIDLGLSHFASLSNGQVIANPAYFKKELKKLGFAQRLLCRKKKGSSNRKKAARRVAKIHRKVVNKRNDFLHKVSTELVKNHDIIAVENLSISGMIQNRRLSRSIADAGWAKFVTYLKYKALWLGKHVVQIGRFIPSSKLCSSCNELQDMPLCIRRYACTACGLNIDRDLNASINIRAAGLAVLNACGGNGIGFPYEARISDF